MRIKLIFSAALFLSLSGVSLQAEASFPNENSRDLLSTISAEALESRPQSDEFMPQVASNDATMYFPAKAEEAQSQSRHFGWLILASILSVASALALRRLPQAAIRHIKQ